MSQIADISDSFTFSSDTELLYQAYIFDMIITGLILVVSLILISIGDILLTLPVQPRQNRRITAATKTAQPILTKALLPLSIIIDPVERSISTDCHAVTDIGDEAMKFITEDGHEKVKRYLEDMEQTLTENDMPAECMMEYYIFSMINHGEYESKTAILQGTGTTMDMYEYLEGTPPQNSDEIAVTTLLEDKAP